jgi:aminoglycoside phosphotransferase (APT) family kinase protein
VRPSPDRAVATSTVRALIDSQFPQWRALPITPLPGSGTDHAIHRIGDALVARFPLHGDDPLAVLDRLRSEAAAARRLLGTTRTPTPVPVAIGAPGVGHALPWAVQTWLPGVSAVERDPSESSCFAVDLATLIGELRAIPTGGRSFDGPGRGGVLSDHDLWMARCLERSWGLLDVPRLRAMWEGMRDLPRGSSPDVTTHGDLIEGNVLVSDDRRLAGLLDVGGLGPADPALDLVGAWHLLGDGPRAVFRDIVRPDADEWQRGRAWAFQQAMGLVWYYAETNPAMSRMGRRTLDRLRTDPG